MEASIRSCTHLVKEKGRRQEMGNFTNLLHSCLCDLPYGKSLLFLSVLDCSNLSNFSIKDVMLLQSAGTDSAVNLWWSSTASSDELISERLIDSPTRKLDPLLHSYNDYEDSVYGLAWSSREPWIFASLSYDGRVVVESVKPFLSRK